MILFWKEEDVQKFVSFFVCTKPNLTSTVYMHQLLNFQTNNSVSIQNYKPLIIYYNRHAIFWNPFTPKWCLFVHADIHGINNFQPRLFKQQMEFPWRFCGITLWRPDNWVWSSRFLIFFLLFCFYLCAAVSYYLSRPKWKKISSCDKNLSMVNGL